MFKTYQDKMMMRQQSLAKNPANYKKEHKERCEFEQKPMKNFDEFSGSKEQEIKQRTEKRLAEKREKVEEMKAKKRKQKSEENKLKEGEMWSRLNELNREFKKIRQLKKLFNCKLLLILGKC